MKEKLRGDMLLHCKVTKADCRQDQIPGRRIGTAIFVALKHVENPKPQNLMYPQHRCSAILLMSLSRIRTMKLHVTPWNEYNFKTKHSDRSHKSIEGFKETCTCSAIKMPPVNPNPNHARLGLVGGSLLQGSQIVWQQCFPGQGVQVRIVLHANGPQGDWLSWQRSS